MAPAPLMRITPLLPKLLRVLLHLRRDGVVENVGHQGLRGLWLKMHVCLRLMAQIPRRHRFRQAFLGFAPS